MFKGKIGKINFSSSEKPSSVTKQYADATKIAKRKMGKIVHEYISLH